MDGQYSDHIYEVDLAAERSLLRDMFGVDFSYEEWATLLEVLDQVVKGDFSPLDLQVAKPGRTSSQYAALNARQRLNQIYDIQFSTGNSALTEDTEIRRFDWSCFAQ